MGNLFFRQRALAKISKTQRILAEVEYLIEAGKYEDAKILATFVDYDESDRESRLHLLLINATLGGPELYQEEIAQLANLSKPSAKEKALVEKILRLTRSSRETTARDFSPPPNSREQKFEPAAARGNFAGVANREVAVHRDEREKELGELKKRLAELSDAKNRAVQALQDTIKQDGELLQAKESALNAAQQHHQETVRSLENRLREKEQLLQSGGESQAIGSEVDRLTAELNELARGKDQDIGLLRSELAQQAELSRTKDEVIKKLKARFAEQIRRMQSDLTEKQNLLASREDQLGSVTARVNELSRERAELISARQHFEERTERELGEKAELLEATASAIDELRDRSSAHVASLERQLAEHQNAIQNNVTHLAELRGQLRMLTEKLAKAQEAQHRAEAMIETDYQTRESSRAADKAPTDAGTKPKDLPLTRLQQRVADWLSGLPRPRQMSWRPITLPKTAWPMVAGVTLIIPVAYFVFAQGRMAANLESIAGWKPTLKNEAVEKSAIRSNNVGKTMSSDNENATIADANMVRAVAYAHVTRRAVPLREWPRYAATAVAPLPAGTPVSVLETHGNWLRIEVRSTGARGYVRKEYVVPQSLARN